MTRSAGRAPRPGSGMASRSHCPMTGRFISSHEMGTSSSFPVDRSALRTATDLRAQPRDRVEPAVHDPLLQRDDAVVSEVDALRAHLAAALGDVAVAQPEVVLRLVLAVEDVERVHVE